MRGYEVSAWAALFAPSGMPAALRDRIAGDVDAVLAEPEVVERYRTLGYEAPNLEPAALAELMKRETRAWGEIIRTAGLRLD